MHTQNYVGLNQTAHDVPGKTKGVMMTPFLRNAALDPFSYRFDLNSLAPKEWALLMSKVSSSSEVQMAKGNIAK